MFVTLSQDLEVAVAASKVWKVYSGLGYSQISLKLFPEMFDKIEVLEGDGGVGTVLLITFPPDASGQVPHYKEKFTVIDDEKRVKVTEGLEGGYLDLGLDHFRVRFQVIEKLKQEDKGEDSCIINVRIENDTEDLAAAMSAVASIQSVVVIMEAVNDYLTKCNSSTNHSQAETN